MVKPRAPIAVPIISKAFEKVAGSFENECSVEVEESAVVVVRM
jgi:hypothetical protein